MRRLLTLCPMHLPDQSTLLEAARQALGARNDKHMAYRLWQEYALEADQPKVSRWRRGLAAPNYEATVVLLHAAGWLNETRIQEAEAALGAVHAEEEEVRRLAADARRQRPRRKTGTDG